MLEEVLNVRQIDGEPRRRWFSDDYFDLIVWFDDDEKILGFQLSYGRFKGEHALIWHRESGYGHYRVDDGEGRPGKPKASPVLLPDGNFDSKGIAGIFKRESSKIDPLIATLVAEKILGAKMAGCR